MRLILIIILLNNLNCYAQFNKISTNFNFSLGQIEHRNNQTIIYGNTFYRYLNTSKDSLYLKNNPPFSNSLGDNYFYILNDSTIYTTWYGYTGSAYKSYVAVSKDTCNTWSVLFETMIDISGVVFWDSLNGITLPKWWDRCLTSNGGLSWTCTDSTPGINNVAGVKQLLNDSSVMLHSRSNLPYTTDYGKTWQSYSINQPINPNHKCEHIETYYWLKKGTVVLTGTDKWVTDRYLFIQNDTTGGFVTHLMPNAFIPTDIYSKNLSTIYILGFAYSDNSAYVLRTKNWGVTYDTLDIGIKKRLYDMEFINDSTAYIVGDGGTLIKWNVNGTAPLSTNDVKKDIVINYFAHQNSIEINTTSLIKNGIVQIFDYTGRLLEEHRFNNLSKTNIHLINNISGLQIARIRADDNEVMSLKYMR